MHARALYTVALLACCSCTGSTAPPDDTPTDAGRSSTWACPEGAVDRASAPPRAPHYTDVTASALAGIDTSGFGRVAIVDLDGDGWDDVVAAPAHDLGHGRASDFERLVLIARPDGTFEDASSRSGLRDTSLGLVVFADVDGDGDQDLYGGSITGAGLGERGIWRNDGTGRFTHAGAAGITLQELACAPATCVPQEMGATFVDADGDGVLDLYAGGWFWSDGTTDTRYTPPPRDRLFRGLGDGTFTDAGELLPSQLPRGSESSAALFGRAAMGVTAGDYDGDGDLDVFVANYGAGRPDLRVGDRLTCEPPRYWDWDLLLRDTGASFEDVSVASGVHATRRGPSGVLDEPPLVIGEECPEATRGSYEAPIGGNSFTASFGDFDNDGDLDLVVGAIAHPDYEQSDPTLLFVNQGAPDFVFTEEAAARGLVYREDEKHAHFADVSGDGLLDVITTGFRDPDENELRVYLQTPDHRFALSSAEALGVTDRHQESLGFFDWDHDGDLDLWIAEADAPARLLRNDGADDNGDLVVRLSATAPRDATGARVSITTTAGRQLREITSGGGHFNPQASRALHFGLGGDACARDVEIRWPDGSREVLGDVRAGSRLHITQGGAVATTD